MCKRSEKGQAVVIVVLAMGLVLVGGIGLAFDSSQLYGQRQMAQVAADAAALGGIMSIYDGTNTGSNLFGSTAFTCTVSTDARTPCKYALTNGFNRTGDQVTVDFPASVPGVSLSGEFSPNAVHVLITRTVSNAFIKIVGGPSTTVVKAAATAAIVDVFSPVPIIVMHPSLSSSFSKNGTNTITICGGPTKSIQVNSGNATSIVIAGSSGTVDLSHAGPKDDGFCNTGTGADFGDWGGPATYPGTILLGSGKYVQPASWIEDPLRNVPEPTLPVSSAPAPTAITPGSPGCPASLANPCMVYSPGRYDGGIGGGTGPGQIPNNTMALFKPGVYYLNTGGFHLGSNTAAQMAIATPDATTGAGAVFYNVGDGNNDVFDISANAGKINGVNYGNTLVGDSLGSTYKNILFFEQHSAGAHTGTHNHSLQGGGGLSITGTIYLTNTRATMLGDATHYQALQLQGTSGSNTTIRGEIVVDTLTLGGTSGITMNLNPAATVNIPQIALVK